MHVFTVKTILQILRGEERSSRGFRVALKPKIQSNKKHKLFQSSRGHEFPNVQFDLIFTNTFHVAFNY